MSRDDWKGGRWKPDLSERGFEQEPYAALFPLEPGDRNVSERYFEPDGPPSELALLLDALADYIRRYVVLSNPQRDAVALFTAHTHVFPAAEATPYLHVTSAEPVSGKTRLFEALELVVARALKTGTTTAAALARSAAKDPPPTLLLDESDNTFKRDREYVAALMGVLNDGYRRGGRTLLCLPPKWEPTLLPVFAPKALAGIGKLPDTVASRSIRIELKRRAPGEQCERFRARIAGAVAAPLYDRLVIWAADSIETLIDARPSIPDELGDRAADVWEPLLAVADLAGGTWPGRARQAAVELSTGERIADDSIGVRLLADCRTAFGDNDRLPTIELIRSLAEDDEAPWANWYGRGQISARELANLLRRYGIASKTIRLDADRTAKGYERKQFEDAWARYLPLPPQTDPAKRHYVTTRMDAGVAGHVDPSQHDPVTDAKDGANPHGYADVTGVTDDARLVGAGPEHAFCRACSSFFCQHVAPNLYSRDPEGESP